MHFSNPVSFFFTLAFVMIATVQACSHCPHPGNFTGRLGWLRNATAAYCGLEGTPVNSTYASVNTAFFDPPDESPCDGRINVTNPTTQKTIQAVVVDKCEHCVGDEILLTLDGLLALSPSKRPIIAPENVTWTFA